MNNIQGIEANSNKNWRFIVNFERKARIAVNPSGSSRRYPNADRPRPRARCPEPLGARCPEPLGQDAQSPSTKTSGKMPRQKPEPSVPYRHSRRAVPRRHGPPSSRHGWIFERKPQFDAFEGGRPERESVDEVRVCLN